MPKDDRDEVTPTEVPWAKFEGPTDPRLKGKILDPRMSGTLGPEPSDSERPAAPATSTGREAAFERLATQYANLSALSLQSRNRTNDQMALVLDLLKRMDRTASAPKGYPILVVVVGLLLIAQIMDAWCLWHLLQRAAP